MQTLEAELVQFNDLFNKKINKHGLQDGKTGNDQNQESIPTQANKSERSGRIQNQKKQAMLKKTENTQIKNTGEKRMAGKPKQGVADYQTNGKHNKGRK